ncbi:MAG: TonB-dependent receptor plug domain-containing protein [Bacteroidales bacterium]|nr:TonB-dependent receptor plug domain-containing protein [Bacteroidales bacterium]
MKKIVFLFALTACLVGCGTSKYVREDDGIDIGYGVQDKDHVTTAVSNVKVKKNEAQTYSNMYDYLRGRVPGVQVTSDNRIIIRGIGTNSGNTDPLILVDGVEMTDLSSIDPMFVKSVDVIKDGSSAIYGMQGANGVIIIKTVEAGGN